MVGTPRGRHIPAGREWEGGSRWLPSKQASRAPTYFPTLSSLPAQCAHRLPILPILPSCCPLCTHTHTQCTQCTHTQAHTTQTQYTQTHTNILSNALQAGLLPILPSYCPLCSALVHTQCTHTLYSHTLYVLPAVASVLLHTIRMHTHTTYANT